MSASGPGLEPRRNGIGGTAAWIWNSAGNLVYQGTTDSQRNLNDVPIVTTVFTQAGIDPHPIIQVTSGSRKRIAGYTVDGVNTIALTLP